MKDFSNECIPSIDNQIKFQVRVYLVTDIETRQKKTLRMRNENYQLNISVIANLMCHAGKLDVCKRQLVKVLITNYNR